MGDVVDINPAHRLVAQIRRELEEQGSLTILALELADIGVDAVSWRGAARRAARQLGRPVQTGQTGSGAWAALRDWPATEAERAHHHEQMRRAVEATAVLAVDDPDGPDDPVDES